MPEEVYDLDAAQPSDKGGGKGQSGAKGSSRKRKKAGPDPRQQTFAAVFLGVVAVAALVFLGWYLFGQSNSIGRTVLTAPSQSSGVMVRPVSAPVLRSPTPALPGQRPAGGTGFAPAANNRRGPQTESPNGIQ